MFVYRYTGISLKEQHQEKKPERTKQKGGKGWDEAVLADRSTDIYGVVVFYLRAAFSCNID